MRALILGSDFAYNSDGILIPIEINTNVGWDSVSVEDDSEKIDLTSFLQFIENNGITKVTYIGNVDQLSNEFSSSLGELNLEYDAIKTSTTSITIPFVEDSETHLVVRTAYDTTALVDDTYCRNKVNFLNLIKNKNFSSQFAYLDDNDNLVSNITEIKDNGNHPNFILKKRFPMYNTEKYPKLFKVTNQNELNSLYSNLNDKNFLMEFHINSEKLYENNIQIFRSLNMIFPPDLESITIGQYTRLTDNSLLGTTTFDSETFECVSNDRGKYITSDVRLNGPKLLNNDLVQMWDGSLKRANELNVGDDLKSIRIPVLDGVDSADTTVNYTINYETFVSDSYYTPNKITNIKKINKLSYYVNIEFEDGFIWGDTPASSYLVIRNNEVRFVYLGQNYNEEEYSLQIGDDVILLNTDSEGTISTTVKRVSGINLVKTILDGYSISVENDHIFLTKQNNSNDEYNFLASIEHNPGFCTNICDFGTPCSKGERCCGANRCVPTSSPACAPCFMAPQL